MDETGTSNYIVILENGERIYPCRCGKIHRDDYAGYTFGHHNCLHDEVLLGFPVNRDTMQAICPQCGMSWRVEISEDEIRELRKRTPHGDLQENLEDPEFVAYFAEAQVEAKQALLKAGVISSLNAASMKNKTIKINWRIDYL